MVALNYVMGKREPCLLPEIDCQKLRRANIKVTIRIRHNRKILTNLSQKVF